MQFLFSLLRIKGLYMFRALLVLPQETLHNRHVVYCVRVVSWLHQDLSSIIPSAACAAPPEDKQVMFETFRGP
jgi:hypothetical protein